MLVVVAAAAYFASFLAVHLLPERAGTLASGGAAPPAGPERWRALPVGLRRATDALAVAGGVALLVALAWRLRVDPVASALTTFFGVCLLRQSFLDAALRRRRGAPGT
jgi:hypothetical protein